MAVCSSSRIAGTKRKASFARAEGPVVEKRPRKEYKSKVYVTVHYSRRKNFIRARKRIESSDVAGEYITIFSANDIGERKLTCDIHMEGSATKIVRVEVPISTYTARSLETPIRRFIAKYKNLTFL